MKRIITLLLLALLCYNYIGYYIIFYLQNEKAEKEFEQYINRGDYLEEELTLFKIPVNQYSQSSQSNFNRVEGDFKHNGKFYEMVKQRLKNDTIYIYCLDDEKQALLYANLEDHVRTHIVDSKGTKSNAEKKAFQNLIKEYIAKEGRNNSFTSYILAINENSVYKPQRYYSPNIAILSPPPKFS